MNNTRIWIKAARPRTLLLSLSGTLTGGFLAATTTSPHFLPMILAAVTAMLLQVLSNLANDYGDFKKGLDDHDRVGPRRVLQSGELSESHFLRGIITTALLCALSGAALLLSAWPHLGWKTIAVFAMLGLLAIAAALLYTLGKRPYGYYGLGDVFCFLFFGWVAVAGTYSLATAGFDYLVLLPASAIGLLSTAVLNINNMRDYANDKAKGKNTLVVRLGLRKAFVYHLMLIVGSFLCLTAFLWLKRAAWQGYVFWLLFPFFIHDIHVIRLSLESGVPDRMLPRQVIFTFLFTVVFDIIVILTL